MQPEISHPTIDDRPPCHQKRHHLLIIILIVTVPFVVATIFIIVHNIAEDRRLDETSVTLKPDDTLTLPFGQTAKVSDFIDHLDGEIVDDFTITPDTLGTQEITFDYINLKHKRRSKTFTINIIDTTAPRIYGQTSYTLTRGYEGDLTDLMFSADDLDNHPLREIIGHYDLDQPGDYNLKYRITDASGNQSNQPFTLHIIAPSCATPDYPSHTPSNTKLPIADVIKTHKTAHTKIGIDVSAWQGDIDWSAVKSSGVEFAFIRLGYQDGYDGECLLDRYAIANLTAATAVGLPVGVYFYSYANDIAEAADQAQWVHQQIQNYSIPLGVAFDWEDWGNFNHTNMSLHTINQVATTFLDTLSQYGYKSSIYSSKVYLDRIWQPTVNNHPVWVAQYYDRVTYTGKYWLWQLSDSGRVKGINGNVDLDIMYLE